MINKIKVLWELPISIVHNRKLMFSLAKNDFKSRFAGSNLGTIWAFIQPVITVLVYWFVFEVGFKAGQTTGYPFVLYLVTGIVPWFFFAESLSGGTNSFIEYSYLVKKVVFHIEILPCVKIISALFVHIFFISFTILLLALYGFYPSLYMIQILYYMFCNIVLVTSLSYLCSAIVVFFRDLNQIINVIILQIGIWMTPIMWDARTMLGEGSLLFKVLKLNPMFYVVDGFRDALLYRQFNLFFNFRWGLYFWIVTLFIYTIGIFLFRRLRVHFADVL